MDYPDYPVARVVYPVARVDYPDYFDGWFTLSHGWTIQISIPTRT